VTGRATYRFEVRAERSDGEFNVVSRAAGVYDSPEEALLQAGTDWLLAANVHPVDVVDAELHGYDVTPFGEPVDAGYGAGSSAQVTGWKEPKRLAGQEQIARAAEVVRRYWMSGVTDAERRPEGIAAVRERMLGTQPQSESLLVANLVPQVQVEVEDPPAGTLIDRATWHALRVHEATVKATLAELRELL
jgi:hypothetical protein